MNEMYSTEYCTTMAKYNHWMNQKIYTICAGIPNTKRNEDLGAFFKSITGTLNHILVADRIWLGRFTQNPFVAKLNDTLYSDFDELRRERDRTDQDILNWTEQLISEWLEAPFTYTTITTPTKTVTRPAGLLVTHFFNHQTHHRGQLTTLFNQLGYDPGVTDLPYMPMS